MVWWLGDMPKNTGLESRDCSRATAAARRPFSKLNKGQRTKAGGMGLLLRSAVWLMETDS